LAWSVQKQGEVVVQSVVEGGGVTRDNVTEIDCPGWRFRSRKPTVVPPLETTFPLLSSRYAHAGPCCGSGVAQAGRDVLSTEKPGGGFGTFRLSDPSWIPEPGLLSFVSVTDTTAGCAAVPPGAVTAGLVDVQPVWPFPQITRE
jgi:hypothetical protein